MNTSCLKLFTFLFFCFLVQSCTSQSSRINGVSFVASRNPVDQQHIDPVIKHQANHAAVMPFGFIRSLNNPEIIYNTERQWFGETRDGALQYIEILHKNKIRVMLKPQIWIWRGEFTGYLKMESEEKWKELEESYSKFILEYASLAQSANVEIFCIGTELEQFIVHRPKYWSELISKIKKVYKGKLTYAANWDEYKRVPFWEQLDYIGVDAYFPISESATPAISEARNGWQRWKQELKAVSEINNRKILFTEYGYRSVDHSGKEPWQTSREEQKVNLDAQANLLTALYEEIWSESWFAGGYIWKWFIEHDRAGGEDNDRFTPQNKPAGLVVQYYYSTD